MQKKVFMKISLKIVSPDLFIIYSSKQNNILHTCIYKYIHDLFINDKLYVLKVCKICDKS